MNKNTFSFKIGGHQGTIFIMYFYIKNEILNLNFDVSCKLISEDDMSVLLLRDNQI